MLALSVCLVAGVPRVLSSIKIIYNASSPKIVHHPYLYPRPNHVRPCRWETRLVCAPGREFGGEGENFEYHIWGKGYQVTKMREMKQFLFAFCSMLFVLICSLLIKHELPNFATSTMNSYNNISYFDMGNSIPFNVYTEMHCLPVAIYIHIYTSMYIYLISIFIWLDVMGVGVRHYEFRLEQTCLFDLARCPGFGMLCQLISYIIWAPKQTFRYMYIHTYIVHIDIIYTYVLALGCNLLRQRLVKRIKCMTIKDPTCLPTGRLFAWVVVVVSIRSIILFNWLFVS